LGIGSGDGLNIFRPPANREHRDEACNRKFGCAQSDEASSRSVTNIPNARETDPSMFVMAGSMRAEERFEGLSMVARQRMARR